MSTNSHRKVETGYEVLVIGGGSAGLSAAMTFGRMRRKVLVCDDNQPRNLPSAHMNNFPGYDGASPIEWRKNVRRELEKYSTIQFHSDRVVNILQSESGFSVILESGQKTSVEKVLLAYGIRDQLPDIPGFKELWGQSVVHCPYCHGFEFQDKPLALFGDGDGAMHMLPLLLGLSEDILLFTQGPSQLNEAQKQKIRSQKIQIIEAPIQSLAYTGPQLEAIVLDNGERIARTALYLLTQFPLVRSAKIGQELGCKVNDFGLYETDTFGKTSVANVYAAGDITSIYGQSVLLSAATGSAAAARIVAELLIQKANF
jgi:thioredoxin reductase